MVSILQRKTKKWLNAYVHVKVHSVNNENQYKQSNSKYSIAIQGDMLNCSGKEMVNKAKQQNKLLIKQQKKCDKVRKWLLPVK